MFNTWRQILFWKHTITIFWRNIDIKIHVLFCFDSNFKKISITKVNLYWNRVIIFHFQQCNCKSKVSIIMFFVSFYIFYGCIIPCINLYHWLAWDKKDLKKKYLKFNPEKRSRKFNLLFDLIWYMYVNRIQTIKIVYAISRKFVTMRAKTTIFTYNWS